MQPPIENDPNVTSDPTTPEGEAPNSAHAWIDAMLDAGYTITAQRGDHVMLYDGPMP